MWFEDLTPYTYFELETSTPPTLNVGWLEKGQPFATGRLAPEIMARLEELVAHGITMQARGLHYCDLCDDVTARGSSEIRVVGADGTRYAAPTLILHYVTVHAYQPPKAFIDALMRAADVHWEAARDRDICLGCGSSMRRGQTHDIYAWLDCAACGTEYMRALS